MSFLLTLLFAQSLQAGPASPIKVWSKPSLCAEQLSADPLATLIQDYRANPNFDFEKLQAMGQQALNTSSILITGVLPTESPAIVMYSGNMCIWCDIILPTYARISSTYRGPKLFLTKDANLRRAESIHSAPQLVLYSADLKVQALGFGKSTADFLHILEILNELSAANLKGSFAILDAGTTRKLYPVHDAEAADRIVGGQAPVD